MSYPQFSDLAQWPCSECPSTGTVANAEYMIEYTGTDPLNCGGDARRAFPCRGHLADLFDYATTVNTGFSPVMVAPLRWEVAA